jgi:hypothetical protein
MGFELDKVRGGGGQISSGHESIIAHTSSGSGLGGSVGGFGRALGT